MTSAFAAPLTRTLPSPIAESRRWVEGKTFPPERPLLNVSQAAPMDPPPEALREEMARVAREDASAHVYGPILGLPELRAEIAAQWTKDYRGMIRPEEVALTSGANQAFTAALATVAAPGDEIIIPTPWYFNHKMACDMAGVRAVALPTGPTLIPALELAARFITPRTRAIVLVTPNNPAGVEYPADLLSKFYALAQARGLALIVDETYRDFDSRLGPPHHLFTQTGWQDTLIHLYSFSKAYRLSGHRLGAMISAQARLEQAEKYLDTVSICPNQIAQHAALWAMRNLQDWKAGERAEILARRQAILDGFPRLAGKGWKLLGTGGFFAWVEHPFTVPSSRLAPLLVDQAGVLLLPGTAFMPKTDPRAERQLRLAFANIDRTGIERLFARLASIAPA